MTELAVLDFETTGLVPGQDEVLQVAVVDETGAVLMNEYCRPQRHTAWADAQKVNGIAPQDVCGKSPFEALVPRAALGGGPNGRFCTADGRAEAKPFRRRVVFRL